MLREEREEIKKFTKFLERTISELELYSGYLKMNPENLRIRDDAISILKDKLKTIKKADDKSDLKKAIRFNDLMEAHDV